jgi:hypothetical protein
MHSYGPDARLSAQPAANHRIADPKRTRGTTLITRPFAGGDQGAVGHPDCGNVQLGAQVQRQAGSSRMITGGGIKQ